MPPWLPWRAASTAAGLPSTAAEDPPLSWSLPKDASTLAWLGSSDLLSLLLGSSFVAAAAESPGHGALGGVSGGGWKLPTPPLPLSCRCFLQDFDAHHTYRM